MMPSNQADTVSFRAIAQWVKAAAQCDIDLADLLRQGDLADALHHPATSRVARNKVEKLMQACIALARTRRPDQYFPLALAEAFSFEYASDLEAFMMTAPTLRDAIPLLGWLPMFYDPGVRMSLAELGAQARLRIEFTHSQANTDLGAPFVEMIAAGFVRFGRMLLGGAPAAGHISFRHASHAHSALYADALKVPVLHEQPLDAVWFDRSLLDKPLRGALKDIHQASAARLAQETQALQAPLTNWPPGSMADQLARALLQHPDWLQCDQDVVAGHLQLGARTLQRRLRSEQTSYSEVVDQVRHQLATQWLADHSLAIDDIGWRLGFRQRSGFTQAFQRWCGLTPARYRQSRN